MELVNNRAMDVCSTQLLEKLRVLFTDKPLKNGKYYVIHSNTQYLSWLMSDIIWYVCDYVYIEVYTHDALMHAI